MYSKFFSQLLQESLDLTFFRGQTLIPDQSLPPELSAVLGEACPLCVHSVSDPLSFCLTVTTASPVDREEREVKGQSFHLSFTDNPRGFATGLNKNMYCCIGTKLAAFWKTKNNSVLAV